MSPSFSNYSAEELSAFVSELRVDLEAAGLSEAAHRLAEIQGTAYTTGSEWQGELKRAVRATFRKEHRLPDELVARMLTILEPPIAERIERRRYWQVMFYASAASMLVIAIASLALLATDAFERYVSMSIGAALAAMAILWISVRKIRVCPGCGMRCQKPTRPFCAHCGMQRASGSPGPRVRPEPGAPRSAVTLCPSCGKPPGGRGRFGRPLPSEGQFCELCGVPLPDVGPPA